MSNGWSKQKRGVVFAKTEGHCAYCGKILNPFGSWHIDHVMPRAQGGTDDIANLVPACAFCNQSKKDKTPDGFRRSLKGRVLGPLCQAGQALSDDAWMTCVDAGYLLDLLLHVYNTIDQQAKVAFYLDGKHGGFDALGED